MQRLAPLAHSWASSLPRGLLRLQSSALAARAPLSIRAALPSPLVTSGPRVSARSFATSPSAQVGEVAAGGLQAFSAAMRRKRSVPLIRQLSISEAFGHASFMLAGTTFLDPDILNLRILSVTAGGANLVFTYFHPVGHPLWIPFGWNAIFILINSGHIYRILYERAEARDLPAQAVHLWRAVFAAHGLDLVDFVKLFRAGTWVTLRKGATLQASLGMDPRARIPVTTVIAPPPTTPPPTAPYTPQCRSSTRA